MRTDGYPTQSDAYGRDFDGQLLFDGTSSGFIHRRLDNGQPYFYLLVAVDTVGNVSVPVKFKGSPSTTSAFVIPPDQVSGFSADLIGPIATSLSWKNPV